MHPPEFKYHHRLSDWPRCNLEVRCDRCMGRSVQYPIKLLIARRGDITFADLMYKLRCKGCHGQPTSIFLCASTARQSGFGLSPGWSLELKPHLAHTAAPERQAKKPSGEESRNEAHRVMKLVKS